MSTNRDKMTQGIDLVTAALGAYLPGNLEEHFGKDWWKSGVVYAANWMPAQQPPPVGDEQTFRHKLDLSTMLRVMERNWSTVFGKLLTPQDRNYLFLVRDARNAWAHHTGGDIVATEAAYNLESMARLLTAIGANVDAKRVRALAESIVAPPVVEAAPAPPAAAAPAKPAAKPDAKGARKSAATAASKQETLALAAKPWRDVIQPHRDVREGRLLEAEFVVNLADVLAGKAEFGYQDAASFFDRTYLTAGLRDLLTVAVERLSGKGGVPVVQLKTAFGGGKTHTMLALYHLARSGGAAAKLTSLEPVFAAAGVAPDQFAGAQVAVLVGTALDATKSHLDAGGNGVEVRTLWGELAAQLGGEDGYALIKTADETGRAPGSDTLVELLDRAGPSVILIDELVAYARNLVGRDDLAGGTFDAVMTFVQALTEAAKRSPRTLVVASIPESDVELGNEAGKQAQVRLEHTFGRMESIWKPISPAEGFEIVRRRLFGPVIDAEAREAVCRDFARLYNDGASGDFPPETAAPSYLDELRRSYPIHPEVFDQLYTTWSTLERFQRTRGVLRLMATVIHELWRRDDRARLILPGTLPLDAAKVRNEFLRYLTPAWDAVVDHDVDGAESEPALLDGENARLGQYQAARRVARSVFLATAPHVAEQGVRGVEAASVRLGALEPNVPLHLVNEALRELAERETYLYSGNSRYWYDTRPNLNRTAETRATQLADWQALEEIRKRLQAGAGGAKGTADNPFGGVHIFPAAGDVPDDGVARLVVLPPAASHSSGGASAARPAALTLLESRGTMPRLAKNMLVFLAPDADGARSLDQAVRHYLAWRDIEAQKDELNLDTYGRRQAKENVERWSQTVDGRAQEAYQWLLVPTQAATGPWEIEPYRIAGQNPFVRRATASLRQNQLLVENLSPKVLRMAIDRWFWRDAAGPLDLKRLWETFTNYGYMDRLRDARVLTDAVAAGLRYRDFFGYAAGVAPDGRLEGVHFDDGGPAQILLDGQSALVPPELAERSLTPSPSPIAMGEGSPNVAAAPIGPPLLPQRERGQGGEGTQELGVRARPVMRRFHGAVEINPERPIPALTAAIEEVVQHLTALPGATVRLTLEIEADAAAGVPDDIVRAVVENSRTLKFHSAEFEEA